MPFDTKPPTNDKTPQCIVLLENLTSPQLVKKFSAFHGTRMFITTFTSAKNLSLFWATAKIKHHKHRIYTNTSKAQIFITFNWSSF